MKYCLLFIMIFYGSSFNNLTSADKSEEPLNPEFFFSQQVPFYFLNSIPASVKLPGKIDLSFFRNQTIVTQYRYRLEVPDAIGTSINRKLVTWSQWTKNNLTEIIVPRLDQEGGYKLIVEYLTPELGETKKFEMPFYVYRVNPKTDIRIAGSKTGPVSAKSPDKTATLTEKATEKTGTSTDRKATEKKPIADNATTKTTTNTIPSTENINKGKESVNNNQATSKDSKKVIPPVLQPQTANINIISSKEPESIERSGAPDYNKLLAEAIERKDTALFSISIQNGAGTDLKGKNGGNIFYLIDETIVSEDLIAMLKNKGFSINDADNDGNSPLHWAILSGNIKYARSLINEGADLNIKNNMELSPLHLAVFLNNEGAVNELLKKGAEINLKGNSGYTPLHVASEMNYFNIAAELLDNGANKRIKTNQRLSPAVIAKIQNNLDMVKLIRKKGSDTLNLLKSTSANETIYLNSDIKQIPEIEFNLPYDEGLAKKRQFSKVFQIISIPVFALSATGTTYLKSKADHFYSLSKIAETESMARQYYDKTKKYDTYTYITGGISLVSAYGLIHSTIRKKSISKKMYKTFN